jgi:hypothetical protein
VGGGAVSKADPDLTGLNPAWRKALAHLIWRIEWSEGTSTSEIARMRGMLGESLKNVSRVTGSNAYFNEVRWTS